MATTRHRPRRGHPGNPLIEGDTGIAAGPQGGAKPGASESGDLSAREFGTPQADLPGGLVHIVNQPADQAKTVAKPERPADYRKRHGVPGDDGQYVTPGDESDLGKAPKPEPVPKLSDAVPVYEVEHPDKGPVIRTFVGAQRRTLLAAFGDGPVKLASRDPHRKSVWLQNENGTRGNVVLLGTRQQIEEAIGLGAGAPEYPCFALIGNTGPQEIDVQDEWYAANPISGTAITISWGYLTEIRAEGLA